MSERGKCGGSIGRSLTHRFRKLISISPRSTPSSGEAGPPPELPPPSHRPSVLKPSHCAAHHHGTWHTARTQPSYHHTARTPPRALSSLSPSLPTSLPPSPDKLPPCPRHPRMQPAKQIESKRHPRLARFPPQVRGGHAVPRRAMPCGTHSCALAVPCRAVLGSRPVPVLTWRCAMAMDTRL